jgi:hypothetical protein
MCIYIQELKETLVAWPLGAYVSFTSMLGR